MAREDFARQVQGKAEVMVSWGNAVKALGDGRIGGYLVQFGQPGQPDLTGDYFT